MHHDYQPGSTTVCLVVWFGGMKLMKIVKWIFKKNQNIAINSLIGVVTVTLIFAARLNVPWLLHQQSIMGSSSNAKTWYGEYNYRMSTQLEYILNN